MRPLFAIIGAIFAVQIVNSKPLLSSRFSRQSGSSSSSSSENSNGNFGFGAAAGIGGVGASTGVGSFNADTRTNPFLPFGAFAGLNLPTRGRIGAGCSGLSCGFQVGDFVAQLPFIGHGTEGGDDDDYADEERNKRYAPNYGYGSSVSTTNANSNANTKGFNNYGPNFGYGYQNPFPFYYQFPQFQFPQFQFPQFQFPTFQFQQPQFYQPAFPQFNQPIFPPVISPIPGQTQNNVTGFSRVGTSGSVNGVYSSSGMSVGPDGKVVTYQSGSGKQPTIETHYIKPGEATGVYSSSGMQIGPGGKVTSYKDSGHF